MWHKIKIDRDGNHLSGCGGRIFVDRAFSNDSLIDLSCIECGWRKTLDPQENALARSLVRHEQKFVNALL